MKNLLRISCCFTAIVLLMTGPGCRKDASKRDPLAEQVTASIEGHVIDENGQPVSNALVTSGSATTTTDPDGHYYFVNIQLNRYAGFVTVEKVGYLKGSRTIITIANEANNVPDIKLIPKVQRGNFSAAAGGMITIQSGCTVNFPADAIINSATNAAYTGTVNVIGAYLDPTSPELQLIMPGNLSGLDRNNELQLLKTYGMVAVELEGAGGEKLNLGNGKRATLTMPIPVSLQTHAPASVPLWFFSETKGVWVEEGNASKQGTNYVGTVSHFTFWNCDVPGTELVNLKVAFKNQTDQPLSSYFISFRNPATGEFADTLTDVAGVINMQVPLNTQLEMAVYNKCMTMLSVQDIGPLVTDIDLGIITINSPAAGDITVSGTVTNCNTQPVTNGHVEIFVDGSIFKTPVNNGSFSITFERCVAASTPLRIFATDVQGSQQSNPVTINAAFGNYTTGAMNACGTSTAQYVNYTINNTNYNFTSPADSIGGWRGGTTSAMRAYDLPLLNNSPYTQFNLDGPGTAPSSPYVHNLEVFGPDGKFYQLYDNVYNHMFFQATITEHGELGQYVTGSFNHPLFMFNTTPASGQGVQVPATGNFRFRILR